MIPLAPWDVLEVDVTENLRSMPRGLARPALVIFRYRGAVLGQAHLLPSELPMTPGESLAFVSNAIGQAMVELACLGTADVRRVAGSRPDYTAGLRAQSGLLDRLDAALAARRAGPARLSATIVVSVGRRRAHLSACLSALASEAAAGREIIVVGSAPDPEAERAVRHLPGGRWLTMSEAGAGQARNGALLAATGDVVLFTEADARPEPGWADALLRRFDRPEVVLVGGPVLPVQLATQAQIATYLDPLTPVQMLPLAFDPGYLDGWRRGPPIWEIGAAANMAVRRDAALRAGGFDTRSGAPEADLWLHLLHDGGHARYEPLAVVRQVPPETWQEARRAAFERSRAQFAALLAAHGRYGARGALTRALISHPRKHLTRLAQAPGRWFAGDPDRLLGATLLGDVAALRHVGAAFGRRSPEPAGADALSRAERDA